MEMARAIEFTSPDALGTRLESALRAYSSDREPQDDQTIIIMGMLSASLAGSDASA